MPDDIKGCFEKARSLEALTSCGLEVMPPRQREVYAKLRKEMESGALGSSDPAVVLEAVSRSLDLDEDTTAKIEEMMREQREERR